MTKIRKKRWKKMPWSKYRSIEKRFLDLRFTGVENALNHFGRVTEAKKVMADSAWHKSYKYNYNNGSNSNYSHYLVNDLLGQRIPITEQQYNNSDLNNPNQIQK